MRRCLDGRVLASALAVTVSGLAEEWPGWRGPTRDGVASGFSAPPSWPPELRPRWRVTVGEGHSSPVASGGRVYTLAREGEEEVVRCLEVSSGKQLWRSSYALAYEVNPAARSHGKGPKSTPALSAGKLYTFGISGILTCFDTAEGKVKWRREFAPEFPSTSPLYGAAASPLLDSGLILVHAGGHDRGAFSAFDAETGEPRWAWGGDGPAYASPIIVELAGERQVVTQTQSRCVGLASGTGKLLWELPFKTAYDQNSVTAVRYRDLLVFSGLEKGTAAIRLRREGDGLAPEEVWRDPDDSMYMSSPVLAGDLLFGMSHKNKGQIFCMEAATGKVRWRGPGRTGENAALVSAGGFIFILTTGAELIVLQPQAPGYEPLAKYKVADSPTWAHPALLGKQILIKDRTSIASFVLE